QRPERETACGAQEDRRPASAVRCTGREREQTDRRGGEGIKEVQTLGDRPGPALSVFGSERATEGHREQIGERQGRERQEESRRHRWAARPSGRQGSGRGGGEPRGGASGGGGSGGGDGARGPAGPGRSTRRSSHG